MPYPSARSLVRIHSLSTSALGHPNETIPMFGCSELFSLFNDTFAWSGLLSEGLVIILFVVADIYRSKSPLVFVFVFFSKNFFTLIEYQKLVEKICIFVVC